MFSLLIIIYCLLFIIITWHNFHHGLILLFALLPTYLIRFSLGPLPTTLLEVMIWIITMVWIIKYQSRITYHVSHIIKQNKLLFWSIGLFLLAATISLFTSINLRASLGEWKAFYVEPILLFIIITTSLHHYITTSRQPKISNFKLQIANCNSTICNLQSKIIFALILSGLATSLLAIYQHFTGFLVPYAFWQNQNTFRVTAWYGFPNAVGLFLAPLVPLTIYLLKNKFIEIKKFFKNSKDTRIQKTNNIKYPIFNISIFVFCFLFLVSSPLAIFYAKSTGAIVGLAAGLGFLLLIYKKTRLITCLVGLVSLVSLVSLPQLINIKQEIFFGDRSGQIRLQMWQDTARFLADHPIMGAGLASYEQKIIPYHQKVNGENIEIFHHPHNIFLTMWVNLGLLGLISFILILIWFIKNCFQISNFKFQIFLLSSMIIILTMGLVDSPYIKNDLAILFWLLPALLIINSSKSPSV